MQYEVLEQIRGKILVSLNCEIIAIDGTNRKNARGQYGCEFIAEVKEKYPDQIVMADLATFEEVLARRLRVRFRLQNGLLNK